MSEIKERFHTCKQVKLEAGWWWECVYQSNCLPSPILCGTMQTNIIAKYSPSLYFFPTGKGSEEAKLFGEPLRWKLQLISLDI